MQFSFYLFRVIVIPIPIEVLACIPNHWKDKQEGAGLPSMEALLIRKNLHWTGHLMRMPNDKTS